MSDLLTTKEAAAIYGCTTRSLWRSMQKAGMRPAVMVEGRGCLRIARWHPNAVMRARQRARAAQRRTRGRIHEYTLIVRGRRFTQSQDAKARRLERLRAFWLARAEQRRAA